MGSFGELQKSLGVEWQEPMRARGSEGMKTKDDVRVIGVGDLIIVMCAILG